jgi:hypothetical protein
MSSSIIGQLLNYMAVLYVDVCYQLKATSIGFEVNTFFNFEVVWSL